jgi:hypothetical protein
MVVNATRKNQVPDSDAGSAEGKVKTTKDCLDCGQPVLNEGYHLGFQQVFPHATQASGFSRITLHLSTSCSSSGLPLYRTGAVMHQSAAQPSLQKVIQHPSGYVSN